MSLTRQLLKRSAGPLQQLGSRVSEMGQIDPNSYLACLQNQRQRLWQGMHWHRPMAIRCLLTMSHPLAWLKAGALVCLFWESFFSTKKSYSWEVFDLLIVKFLPRDYFALDTLLGSIAVKNTTPRFTGAHKQLHNITVAIHVWCTIHSLSIIKAQAFTLRK